MPRTIKFHFDRLNTASKHRHSSGEASAPHPDRLPSLLFNAHRNLNLSLAGRTFPRKFHHPITSHLRLKLYTINSWRIGLGHVASGIHDHTRHIHSQISLHLSDILGLAVSIGEPN